MPPTIQQTIELLSPFYVIAFCIFWACIAAKCFKKRTAPVPPVQFHTSVLGKDPKLKRDCPGTVGASLSHRQDATSDCLTQQPSPLRAHLKAIYEGIPTEASKFYITSHKRVQASPHSPLSQFQDLQVKFLQETGIWAVDWLSKSQKEVSS